MNVKTDLLGKTITGVIATSSPEDGAREIWVLQFADGSHVEFVSPGARRALRRAAQQGLARAGRSNSQKPDSVPMKLSSSRSLRYQHQAQTVEQLTLNVA
jgi:hypothetical protein